MGIFDGVAKAVKGTLRVKADKASPVNINPFGPKLMSGLKKKY